MRLFPIRFHAPFLAILGAGLIAVCGCGEPPAKEIEMPLAQIHLRNVVLAYNQAAIALNRPPQNVDDIRPYLSKQGDVKQLLRSPNGEEFVIQWGYDTRNAKVIGETLPVWIYEKSATEGKRWVVRGRNSLEITDEDLQNASFAPGMKKPF